MIVLAMITMGVTAAERFSEPINRVTYPHDFSWKPVPTWQNGFFLSWDYPEPVLFMFDSRGRLRNQVTIRIPNAGSIMITHASASPSGAMAVSGSASSGGAGAAFIAWIDSGGVTQRVVRTTPFAPYRLYYASDGTLWVLGRVIDHSATEDSPHDILRHYGADGTLIRSTLPSDSFSSSSGRHPSSGSFLAGSKALIGVYSVGRNEWVEVSRESSQITGRWPGVSLASGDKITGAAITESGSVYVSVKLRQHPPTNNVVYRLDRAKESWVPLDATSVVGDKPGRVVTLFGADGNRLVVGLNLPDLYWLSEP